VVAAVLQQLTGGARPLINEGGAMVRSLVALVGLLGFVLRAAPVDAADGTLDPSFGTGGSVLSTFDFTGCGGQSVVQQPDGKLTGS
jgi:hypothetical protein